MPQPQEDRKGTRDEGDGDVKEGQSVGLAEPMFLLLHRARCERQARRAKTMGPLVLSNRLRAHT